MKSLTLKSPAKVNLFLKVLGRRSDGYHNLATLFHRISLSDTLHLRKKKQGFSLTIQGMKISAGEDNLITRAYRLLEKECPGVVGGVSVCLKKGIPLGAGLGGGSSNAAFFLLGMKKLYRLGISLPRLLKMGRSLGADVPFFLLDTPQAFGLGVGERLQKCPVKKKGWFVLVLSNQGLATKTVFENVRKSDYAGSLTNPKRAVKLISHFFGGKNHAQIGEWFVNDLEVSAFRLRPFLRKVLESFKQLGVRTARMSGSGSTFFAVFATQKEALRIQKELRVLFLRQFGKAERSKVSIKVCQSF